MANGDGGSQFYKGLIFGGLIGGAIALLYAPKSGKELREAIQQGSRELVDGAEDKMESVQDKMEQLLADTKMRMEELMREAAMAVDELKNTAHTKYDAGKTKVAEEQSKIKNAIEKGAAAYRDEDKKSKKA